SPASRNFSETVTISGVKVTGAAGGVHLALKVSCGSPCSLANHFPQGRTLGSISGKISYHDAIRKGKAHTTPSKYPFTVTKSGYPAFVLAEPSLSSRCDQALGATAGCVFPKYSPFLTSLASLPNVAANIAKAQGGPGHYGRPGSGGHTLHRITSTTQQAKN